MKKPGRFLFALCVALLCAFVSPAFVSADTVCKSKSQVQSELKEQLSVKGVSELVMTTDFSMKDSDIADVLDEAATANGKIYYGKVKYSITTRRGSTTSYTYKITVDPANFVKLSKYNSEKKLYVACLKALYEQDYTKRFYTGDEGCYDSMLLVLKQHPEFNYAVCATKYTSLSGRIFCGFRPSDSFSASKISTMMKETDKKADSIIRSVIKSGMSNSEKIGALHEYVVQNCAYAEDPDETAYTAYGCLVKGKAVCQGYTGAMNLLMAKCGIYSIGVAGKIIETGESHAWNYVKCGGLQYVDATWDDPLPDRGENYFTDYLLTDSSHVAKTHSWSKTEFSEKYIDYSKKFLKKVF